MSYISEFFNFYLKFYLAKETCGILLGKTNVEIKLIYSFQDPKVYVQTVLDVHKKYNALVMVAFNNDAGFVAALDKACGRFININNVTKLANTSSKSPELLARYCDLLLKKSSKNPEEAELEDTLNQVMRRDLCLIMF